MALPLIAAALAPVLGKAAGSRAAGKRHQEETDLQRDRNKLDSYLAGLRAPQERLTTGVRASRVANAQPVKINWGGRGSGGGGTGAPPAYSGPATRGEGAPGATASTPPSRRGTTITGGHANPDSVSPELKGLAADILGQQISQQGVGTGDVNRGGPPKVSERPKSNWLDKVLGVGAFASSLIGTGQIPGLGGGGGAAPAGGGGWRGGGSFDPAMLEDNEWYEGMG